MIINHLKALIASVTIALLLTSCAATVPMMSERDDGLAKQFRPAPLNKSNIYLYRDEFLGSAVAFNISLDGHMEGQTGAQTYYLWTVNPGRHVISSAEENVDTITLYTKPGKNYYIWQEVKMGMFSPRVALHQVDEATGKQAVLQCKRAKSSDV